MHHDSAMCLCVLLIYFMLYVLYCLRVVRTLALDCTLCRNASAVPRCAVCGIFHRSSTTVLPLWTNCASHTMVLAMAGGEAHNQKPDWNIFTGQRLDRASTRMEIASRSAVTCLRVQGCDDSGAASEGINYTITMWKVFNASGAILSESFMSRSSHHCRQPRRMQGASSGPSSSSVAC